MMTEQRQELFNRAELLLGSKAMEAIAWQNIIIFGVGGVGSWCAEGLVRSGASHLTMVDFDRVCESNCNRQAMATTKTIGEVKADALYQRLISINPHADIKVIPMAYNADSAPSFQLEQYDYVIDAIDSLKDKVHLILHATSIPSVTLFSSMGAALRSDPFKVHETEFWKIKGDPLARALRNRFKRDKTFPHHKFRCVYSEEVPLINKGESNTQANGSLCHVTAIFGFALAGMVIRHITNC